MRCHNCGSDMIQNTNILIFYNNNSSIEIPHIKHWECPKCGEIIIALKEAKEIETYFKNFQERGKNHEEEHDC